MKITIINQELNNQHFRELVNLCIKYLEKGMTIQDMVYNIEMVKADLVDMGRFEEEDDTSSFD